MTDSTQTDRELTDASDTAPDPDGSNARGDAFGGFDPKKQSVAVTRTLGRLLFGDRTGLALFLGAVLWLGALWRVGIFIQDTVTVANALANVAGGRLALVESPYSLVLGPQPGTVGVDGQLFGRNYGHVLFALPLLYALQGLTVLVEPKILLAGLWSLGLVALAVQAGDLTGRKRVRNVGSVVALLVFTGNVITATALPEGILALVALQLSTLFVAAYIAVVLYRLLRRFHGRHVGVAAGIVTVAATPIGFWATIPKRHVVTAGAAIVALYCFAVSRDRSDRRGVLARGGAYAILGLLTTVHPFEAFFLFAVLVPVDLLTAPTNSPRSILLVGLLFVLSLLPFFTLNTLISGNPLESPRLIGGAGSGLETDFAPTDGGDTGASGGGDGGSGDTGGTTAENGGNGTATTSGGNGTVSSGDGDGAASTPPGDDTDTPLGGLVGLFGAISGFVGSLVSFLGDWLDQSFAVLGQHERLYHIFVRSGEIPSISTRLNDYEAIELTLLETFPLAATLLWLPVAVVQRARERAFSAGLTTARRQTDLLAAGFVGMFTLIYLPRLPLHSQITVRYIVPVIPLLVYGLARCSFVHRAVTDAPQWVLWGYLATVIGGTVVVTGALSWLDPAIGEAMQFHALVGLGAAATTTIAVVSWPLHEDIRAVATGVALSAGVTTVFLLVAKIEYFSYRLPSGHNPRVYALDIVRLVAELIPIFPH